MITLKAIDRRRPAASLLEIPDVDVGPEDMAEVNERLARVETRLDGQGDTLHKLERHMETMSNAQSEMAKAVSQFPQILEKSQNLQEDIAAQNVRLAENEERLKQAEDSISGFKDRVEPKVNRSHVVASIAAWLAAALIVAVAGAMAHEAVNLDIIPPAVVPKESEQTALEVRREVGV